MFIASCGWAKNYYVNDANTNGDVYTTAAGLDVVGNGTNAAAPMLSLTNLVASYDLEPGDIVWIDTGNYSNYTVTITNTDGGSAASPVIFRGSTNSVAGGSVINRANASFAGVSIDGASHLVLEYLTIRNGAYGVNLAGATNCVLRRLKIISNSTGVYGSSGSSNKLDNCLLMNSSTAAFQPQSTTFNEWINCLSVSNVIVFYQDFSQGAWPFRIRNNIFYGDAAVFSASLAPGSNADYCVFWNSSLRPFGGGKPALVTLQDMQQVSTSWFHSIVADPGIVDLSSIDLHLRSIMGRWNPATGSFVTDTVHSVAIDFGDPTSLAYTNEPDPNGGRVDAGYFGGTDQASKSQTNAWLLAITLNDGGTIFGTQRLYWGYGNIPSNETVRIDYSADQGQTWNPVVTNWWITNSPYAWAVPTNTPSVVAYWRIAREADTAVRDTNDNYFVIRNPSDTFSFYVNDGSVVNDAFCSAPGAATNEGRSASSPKDRIQDILDAYDLGPGDTIYVDTGSYLVSNTITITTTDQGEPGRPLLIQGSTNSDLNSTAISINSSAKDIFYLYRASFCKLANMTLKGGNFGVDLLGDSATHSGNCDFYRMVAETNQYGFYGQYSDTNRFTCCVTKGVKNDALYNNGNNAWTWDRGISWSNAFAFRIEGSGVNALSISNSVIVGNTAFRGAQTPVGDYSLLWNATVKSGINNLAALQLALGTWYHSTYFDPLFASLDGQDFHPKSIAGRYVSGSGWVTTDTVHSILIDMGDPTSSIYTNEPSPNGSRMNVGLNAGMVEASKSRTTTWVNVLSYNDGGILRGGHKNASTDTVYWVGGNYSVGATVRIEISGDQGASWTIAATGITASAGSYTWASTNYDSSTLFARWRVILEQDVSVNSSNRINFEFRNGAFKYYVNDASTNNDVYTSAAGSDANLGTGPGSPKATLVNLLTNYTMYGGDIIYVDTGTYTPQEFNASERDTTPTYVTILGSTNWSAGGTVFQPTAVGAGNALYMNGVDYVYVQNIICQNARNGVLLDNGASNNILERMVMRYNLGNGISVTGSPLSAQVRQCIVWNNTNAGVRVDSGSIFVSNSVIAASGYLAYGYNAAAPTSIIGDYNDLYAGDLALAGYLASLTKNLDTLGAWVQEVRQELHSLNAFPLFAAPSSGDYHLMTATRNGRYVSPGRYTNDAVTSQLIDAGNPQSDFSSEPIGGGRRVDIGLYGNTAEASLGRTNAWLYCAYPENGGWQKGTGVFHWVAGAGATSQTVTVEYSPDGGVDWFTLGTGVPATNELLEWNTVSTNDTPAVLWRVTSETDPTVTDDVTNFFAIRNSPLSVFVNDHSTLRDIYTSGIGAPTNWLATSNQPLDSLSAAFTLFDLEPGDRVLVDAGSYTSTVNALITRLDSGASNALMSLRGSTNVMVGSSTLNRDSGAANAYGLQFDAAEWVSVSNLILRGGRSGIYAGRSGSLQMGEVRSVSNSSHGVDIATSTNIIMTRVVISENGGYGLNLSSAGQVRFLQSVIWSNAAGGIQQVGGSLFVTNSVLTAFSPATYLYAQSGGGAISADYNDMLKGAGAGAAVVNTRAYEFIAQWRSVVSNDIHSLSRNPLFANPAAGDFHLLSEKGRHVPGSLTRTNDPITSTLIDAGDPLSAFVNEPAPNGSRINIGLYGNHLEASMSRTSGWFAVISLNDGGSIRSTNILYWVSGGAATSQTVTIQYSIDDGNTWSNVTTNVQAGVNFFEWNTTPINIEPRVYWRVISNVDPSIRDTNDVAFVINNGSIIYYVNDSSTNGDLLCTAVGSSANDGVTPAAPKASIVEVLKSFSLRPEDAIYIETGQYALNQDVSIIGMVASISNRFLIRGSTNYAVGGAVLDFQNRTNSFLISGSEGVELRNLVIAHASVGVQIADSTNTLLDGVRVQSSLTGFRIATSTNSWMIHCLARDCTQYGLFQDAGAASTLWRNGVMWSNVYGVYLASSISNKLTFENSDISSFGAGQYGFYLQSGILTSDYNNIFRNGGAWVGYRVIPPAGFASYQTLTEWVRDLGQDIHSLSHNPSFANVPQNDFHLASRAGRFDQTSRSYVTTDTNTSWLIDAGNPLSVVSNEPNPNGFRVNIGMFGNSGEASKSPTNARLACLSLNDGGWIRDTVTLRWLAYGAATGHTVYVDYSADGGSTWSSIVTSVSAKVGECVWTSATYQASPIGVWRVGSLSEGGVIDRSDGYFELRTPTSTPPYKLDFYVNDSLTNGDVYCSAPGSNSNLGAFASAPKNSLQAIVDDYDLEPGDMIYMDTGTYALTNAISIGQYDSGEATNRVTIQGSTNVIAGGSVLSRYGIQLNSAGGIALRNLVVSNAAVAVSLSQSDNCSIEWVTAAGGIDGFDVIGSSTTLIQHCTARNNSSYGLYHGVGSQNTRWHSGVLWSNVYGVYVGNNNSGDLTIDNSVIGVFGALRYAYYVQAGVLTSDYNNVYRQNDGRAAYRFNQASPLNPNIDLTLTDWVRETGRDGHSLSHEPQFFHVESNDYHLLSMAGRYDPSLDAFVVEDTNSTSPMIDAGNPTSEFTNEAAPNGSRINIGLYGNSAQASLSPSTGRLTCVSLNDGGWVRDVVPLYWVASGEATGHTVHVDYSANAGNTWASIVSNVPAAAAGCLWTSTLFQSSAVGSWRVISEQDGSVGDTNDLYFALRNTALKFYVNDTNSTGDVYCSAWGSTNNLGESPGAPKDSVQDIIDGYDLQPGDTIYVDTGTYLLTNNITFGQFDGGVATNGMVLQGSTNELEGGTVLLNNGIVIDGVNGVVLRNLVIINASKAVALSQANDCRIEWVWAADGVGGFEVIGSDEARLSHCVARNNANYGLFQGAGSDHTHWENGVLWSNLYAVYVNNNRNGDLTVENSVIGAFGSGRFAFLFMNSNLTSDYNNIYLQGGAYASFQPGTTIPNVRQYVSRWARDYGYDKHSLSHEPGFKDAPQSDFHPRSRQGHYSVAAGQYVADTDTSVLIDAGRPGSDYATETAPNGSRVNIGLYGNSTQASKTPLAVTNSVFTCITVNDGGRIEGTTNLIWSVCGPATGHTVRLEYSSDAGTNWTLIASNVQASAGVCTWTSSLFESSIQGVWKITSESQTNLNDRTDQLFALRNTALSFYVNDASLVGDVYCTNTGNAAYSGARPGFPKTTVQGILDAWDVEPGDTIYIDTGNYLITSDITLGQFDAGEGTNRVVFQGSTNDLAGGAVITKFGGGNAVRFFQAEGGALRNLTIRNAGSAIRLESSDYALAEWVRCENCTFGLNLLNSDSFQALHCLSLGNSQAGLMMEGSSDVAVQNGVFWSNGAGCYVKSGSLDVRNSIFGALVGGQYGYKWALGSITSDYNNLYLINGGAAAALLGVDFGGGTSRYQSASSWVQATGKDLHSRTDDPRFADVENEDFHLRSDLGRYSAASGWVLDSEYSPLIDAGNPDSPYQLEPTNNGSRINIDLYGNSTEASKSRTNASLSVISLDDGGYVTGAATLMWSSHNMSGRTVNVQFSWDNGNSWITLTTGLLATANAYVWDTSVYTNSIWYRWRVGSDSTPGLFDTNRVTFTLANNGFSYYVNDAVTNGDVYCTAAGSALNEGDIPSRPKASIQDVLNTYDLEPKDRIYVDTGEYLLTENINMYDLDSGTAANPIIIQGSTNEAAGGTVINRQTTESTIGIFLYQTRGIHLRNMVIKNAGSAASLIQSPDCLFEFVTFKNCSLYGVQVNQCSASFEHCVARDNTLAGISIESGASVIWQNGIIWGDTHAVTFSAGSGVFSNSILRASGSGKRIFNLGASGSVKSDYNDLIHVEGAYVGELQHPTGGNDYYPTLTDWSKNYGQDRRSLSHDPAFADVVNEDYHPQSVTGRYVPGAGWTNDNEHSPVIDTAARLSPEYTNEPAPNGGRLNIGLHGGTSEASKSRTNAWLLAVSVNDGGTISGTNELYWAYGGMSSSDMVRIDYSLDNGVAWTPIASNVTVSLNSISWDVSALPVTFQGRWRVISEQYDDAADTNDATFTVKNVAVTYWVNDASTNGDIYTLAIGNSTNSGRSPSFPLNTPLAVVQKYGLGAGDLIYVDTGLYQMTNVFLLDELNRGLSGFPIRVQGSTNLAAGGTLLENLSTNLENHVVLWVSNTRYIEADHVRARNGGTGVRIDSSLACKLTNIDSYSNRTSGFSFSLADVVASRCAAWMNDGYGLSAGGGGAVYWDQGVIWSNYAGAVQLSSAALYISNSILHTYVSSTNRAVIFDLNQGTINSDYNLFTLGAGAIVAYENFYLLEYSPCEWVGTGNDRRTIIGEARFADARNGDFHLRSTRGRYVTGVGWTNDADSSLAIDAGDVGRPFDQEPDPNGWRLNVGLYGDSNEESQSPTNQALLAVSLNSGCSVIGVTKLYWVSAGFPTTATVRLEYSSDGGGSWPLVIATNLSMRTSGYDWNPFGFPSSPQAMWRVVSEENPAISDSCDVPFFLRLGPYIFYVNDATTNGDMYCTAIGRATNLGLSASTPKDTVQGVLNAYDLEGADIIKVDTGHYLITNTVTISSADSGNAQSNMVIMGSTNYAFGGTRFDCATTSVVKRMGIQFNFGQYVLLSDIITENADFGLRLFRSQGLLFSNMIVRDSWGGVTLSQSASNNFSQCVFHDLKANGINSAGSSYTRLDDSVIWSNQQSAIVVGSGNILVNHSVLQALRTTNYIYSIGLGGAVSGDYNDLVALEGAKYGAIQDGFTLIPMEGLPQWVAATTQDIHSLSHEPYFADPANDDFHPQSVEGRYVVGSGWTTDSVQSPLIDTGDPTADWTREPAPNGSRRNIGRYGNTDEASKSQTNGWALAITANNGGREEGTFYLVWSAGGVDATNLVSLDYSYDNGVTWTNIIRDRAIGDYQYLWNSAEQQSGFWRWPSSPIARWRLVMESDTNVWDMTDDYFALRNEPFRYYVNDNVTNNDLWTTAVGSDSNLGIFAFAPKATLKSLLDALDVEGGDAIYIDTGTYSFNTNENNNVSLTVADEGRSGEPVWIFGSTNAEGAIFEVLPTIRRDTVLNIAASHINVQDLKFIRGNVFVGSGIDVTLQDLRLTNANVSLASGSALLTDTIVDNGQIGVSGTNTLIHHTRVGNGMYTMSGRSNTLESSLSYGGTGAAVFVSGGTLINIRNVTMKSAKSDYVQAGPSSVTIENSILIADGSSNLCYDVQGGTLIADYNDLVIRNNAWIGYKNGLWEKVIYWQRESGQDANSMAIDPIFADELANDFHLKSTGGRWTGSTWTNDSEISPCLDAGDPASTWTNEPSPNGGRVNIGAYGNTPEASKSQTDKWIQAVTANDGGVFRDTVQVKWVGGNFDPGDTVTLRYSTNGAATWVTIVSGIPATNYNYDWDTTLLGNLFCVYWGVVLDSDAGINSENEQCVDIRNSSYNFYVNDGVTVGDIYTSAAGSPANDGLSTSAPLDSVQGILTRYDTEGGDTIWADTGIYDVTADMIIYWSDSGYDIQSNLVIRGSTNFAAGGSVFLRGNTNAGNDIFEIKGSYIKLKDMTLKSAYRGVWLDAMNHASIERMLFNSNMYGMAVGTGQVVEIKNNRFWQNAGGGVVVDGSVNVGVENNTFYGNRLFAIRPMSSINVTMQNNIISITINSGAAYSGELQTPFVDYNVYDFVQPGYIFETNNDLLIWQLNYRHDYRSIFTNPVFAGVASGDFHIVSSQGRYQDGVGWVLDAQDSWAIDKGNPLSLYSLEPTNNGDRINIGAYGNTEYASKSTIAGGDTNVTIYCRTGNGYLYIPSTPWPLIWTVVNPPAGLTFAVQYSGDNGRTWVNISVAVPAEQEYVLWNLTSQYNTYDKGRWRIVGEGTGNTNYWDINDGLMDMFFGEFAINRVNRSSDRLNNIRWTGAWDETYQVQYSTNILMNADMRWVNAPDGPDSDQKANFLSTQGGDMFYEDVTSTNRFRLYRVVREEY